MTVYSNSKVDTYYARGLESRNSCQVRISEGTIAVSYEVYGRFIVYEGGETGDGHYRLTAAPNGGRATLHKIPDEDILEGSWIEDGEEGMCRIDLQE